MGLQYYLAIALTLFAGSVLQGAVGFAYALFSVPILVWLGLDLSHAVAMMTTSILAQLLVATYQLRAQIKWRAVLTGTLIRYLTIPFGILLLTTLVSLDLEQVKQILGAILLAVLFMQMFGRVEPRDSLHIGWTWLAFSVSGIMQGMVSMGGPPVVLWVMAHRWTNQETRAFLFALFMLGGPMQALWLYVSFGEAILWPMGLGLLFAPVVAGGATLGVYLGNFIPKAQLRQLAFAILYFIAFGSLIEPLFG